MKYLFRYRAARWLKWPHYHMPSYKSWHNNTSRQPASASNLTFTLYLVKYRFTIHQSQCIHHVTQLHHMLVSNPNSTIAQVFLHLFTSRSPHFPSKLSLSHKYMPYLERKITACISEMWNLSCFFAIAKYNLSKSPHTRSFCLKTM